MGELTIKLDDAELLEALTEMAKARKHSLDDEVTAALRRAVAEHERKLELLRTIDAIAAMTPKGVTQSDSTELLREDRAR